VRKSLNLAHFWLEKYFRIFSNEVCHKFFELKSSGEKEIREERKTENQ